MAQSDHHHCGQHPLKGGQNHNQRHHHSKNGTMFSEGAVSHRMNHDHINDLKVSYACMRCGHFGHWYSNHYHHVSLKAHSRSFDHPRNRNSAQEGENGACRYESSSSTRSERIDGIVTFYMVSTSPSKSTVD